MNEVHKSAVSVSEMARMVGLSRARFYQLMTEGVFPPLAGSDYIKANPKLADMSLVTSMRLSVQPVTEEEWIEVCRMGGLDDPPR